MIDPSLKVEDVSVPHYVGADDAEHSLVHRLAQFHAAVQLPLEEPTRGAYAEDLHRSAAEVVAQLDCAGHISLRFLGMKLGVGVGVAG